MNWYKKAQFSSFWHISNEKFKKFNPNKTAQGIIWFAKDKDGLLKDLHGASINNQKQIYLYECNINLGKIAGWDEYDKYGLGELRQLGYDTIDLDDDIAVLSPNNITIKNITKIK